MGFNSSEYSKNSFVQVAAKKIKHGAETPHCGL
jgi:hypothetical protein